MGCDIHLYLEHKGPDWNGWSGSNRFSFSRNYGMFAAMAGVRQYDSDIISFAPKGIPNDIDWHALSDYTLFVSDIESDGHCNRETADRYVSYGSVYWNGDKSRVTHPDWHTPSWLTLDEFKTAYERYLGYFKEYAMPDFKKFENDPSGLAKEWESLRGVMVPVNKSPEIEAIIAYLGTLEQFGYKTRLVFWFDN